MIVNGYNSSLPISLAPKHLGKVWDHLPGAEGY